MAQDSSRKPHFPPPIPNPALSIVKGGRTNKAPDAERTDPMLTRARAIAAGTPAHNAPELSLEESLKSRMPDLGIITSLVRDPEITEIMVNDLRNIMVERGGRIEHAGMRFQSLDELNRLIHGILEFTGRVMNAEFPYVDAMLPDGSRINIIGPPLVVGGPSLTIRKFPQHRFSIEELITREMLDPKMAGFLRACVAGRMNIIISGGTGSGKTTLLNALIQMSSKEDRIITIEDTPELAVPHVNSVRMQTKPQTPTSPAITTRELLANALRMRPDRIFVGECRRAEALDMLSAMNTGHAGSMTTLHANSPRDALSRLETLCLMSELDIPLTAVRKQIAGAVDLLIHLRRFRGGIRRITSISEITGMEGDMVLLNEIYLFEHDAKQPGKAERGRFRPSGMVPALIARLAEEGIEVPRTLFT